MMISKGRRQEILDDFLARNGGRFDPAAFLEEAKSIQHPAHEWFQWDDEKAAHDHRINQARMFVRDLKVTVRVEHRERGETVIRLVDAPAVVSTAYAAQGAGYLSTKGSENEALAALSGEASRALMAWLRRYEAALVWATPGEAENGAGSIRAIAADLQRAAGGPVR